jgi:hypothetical protein
MKKIVFTKQENRAPFANLYIFITHTFMVVQANGISACELTE